MKCIVCKKDYLPRRKTSLYCSNKCFGMSTKGIKRPHSKEWEENRLKAVRNAMKNKVFPRGYKRPIEHTKPMLDALKKKMKETPERYKQIAIKNLSKNKTLSLSKENSPNWKGGITADWQKWRSENGKNFDKMRNIVKKRDIKCKDCGSTKNLECHHIISVSDSKETAFLPMNGVLLCRDCHRKTDSFGGKSSRKFRKSSFGNTTCIMKVIPNNWQAYPTVGNYQWTDSGTLVIFVSDMKNDDYHMLVFIHELIEAYIAKHRGIKLMAIDAFDINFEKEREQGLHGPEDEPGYAPDAPYKKEHFFAEAIERLVAGELGVDWKTYEDTIVNL